MAKLSHPHPQWYVNGVATIELNYQFQVADPLWNTSMYYNPAAIFVYELLPMINTILHYSIHAPSPAHPVGRAC